VQLKLVSETNGQRTVVVILDDGEEVISELTGLAIRHGLWGAHFTAIGAFSAATLGFFDIDRKDYLKIPVPQQVEVVSLAGNIALDKGLPKVHAHAVVARADGIALGGHLLEARVRPTLEAVIVESPKPLRRRMDEATGLALIDLSEPTKEATHGSTKHPGRDDSKSLRNAGNRLRDGSRPADAGQ
jgi:predicted DNA-binding protein with PD1-like motif